MSNSLYIQHGKPTLLAIRVESCGFQSVMEGIAPDFNEAWGTMGDEHRELVAHLAAQALIHGHQVLDDFQAGKCAYYERYQRLGQTTPADERLTVSQVVANVLADLVSNVKYAGGWDPSVDLRLHTAVDVTGNTFTFEAVRNTLERLNSTEAARVLKRLQAGRRAMFRVADGTVDLSPTASTH